MILADFPLGDPTVLGWTTFSLYFVASGLCIWTASAGRGQERESAFARSWRVLAVLLVLLGLNKQLDLQTTLIELGRRLALAARIYHHRRDIQLFFIIGLMVGLMVAVIACRKPLAAFASKHRVGATGFGLIGAYAFIRAGSIDHVDGMLGFDLEDAPGLWVLEVLGLILVIGAATMQNRERKAESRNLTNRR